MLTILTDVQITRRKRSHLIVDADGMSLYAASRIGDVLAWMVETGQEEIAVEGEGNAYYHLRLRQLALPLSRFRANIQQADPLIPGEESEQNTRSTSQES